MKIFKILCEEIDRDDILYHTLEMFGYGKNFKDSSFLTYEGEYIGKEDSNKIANDVLSVMDIETFNPIETYLDKTQSVEMNYKDGNIIVSILKGNTLSNHQVEMITDLLHSISGDVIIKILDGGKAEEYIFEQHQINQLKRFLRRIEGLNESLLKEDEDYFTYETLPDILENAKTINNADGGVILYKEEDGKLQVFYEYICHVSSLRKFKYYSGRMNPKHYPLKLNSSVLRDYKITGDVNIVHSLMFVETTEKEFDKYINENDELFFEDLLNNNDVERMDIIERRNILKEEILDENVLSSEMKVGFELEAFFDIESPGGKKALDNLIDYLHKREPEKARKDIAKMVLDEGLYSVFTHTSKKVINEYWDNKGKFGSDSSIRPDNPDSSVAFEFNSPAFSVKPVNTNKLKKFLNMLPDLGIKTNDSCGFHTHFSYHLEGREGAMKNEDLDWFILQFIMLSPEKKKELVKFNDSIEFVNSEYADMNIFNSFREDLLSIKDLSKDERIDKLRYILLEIKSKKYINIRIHPTYNTLEWRGVRGFLNSGKKEDVKKYIEKIMKFIKLFSDLISKKSLEDLGIKKEDLFIPKQLLPKENLYGEVLKFFDKEDKEDIRKSLNNGEINQVIKKFFETNINERNFKNIREFFKNLNIIKNKENSNIKLNKLTVEQLTDFINKNTILSKEELKNIFKYLFKESYIDNENAFGYNIDIDENKKFFNIFFELYREDANRYFSLSYRVFSNIVTHYKQSISNVDELFDKYDEYNFEEFFEKTKSGSSSNYLIKTLIEKSRNNDFLLKILERYNKYIIGNYDVIDEYILKTFEFMVSEHESKNKELFDNNINKLLDYGINKNLIYDRLSVYIMKGVEQKKIIMNNLLDLDKIEKYTEYSDRFLTILPDYYTAENDGISSLLLFNKALSDLMKSPYFNNPQNLSEIYGNIVMILIRNIKHFNHSRSELLLSGFSIFAREVMGKEKVVEFLKELLDDELFEDYKEIFLKLLKKEKIREFKSYSDFKKWRKL